MSAPRHVFTVPALALGALALPLLLAVPPARAATTTWVFTGEVQAAFGMIGTIDTTAYIGEPMIATVVFDDERPDQAPASPTAGVYTFDVPPYSYTFQIGDLSLGGHPKFRIGVSNNFNNSDALTIFPLAPLAYPGQPNYWIGSFEVGAYDSTATAFASDALFSEPVPLDAFDDTGPYMLVNGCFSTVPPPSCFFTDWSFFGRYQSWTLPEPQAGASAGALALASLAFARRRRR